MVAARAREIYDRQAKERMKLSQGRGIKGPANLPDVKSDARAREIYDRQAKERMKAGGGDKKSKEAKSGPANLPDPIKSGLKVRRWK